MRAEKIKLLFVCVLFTFIPFAPILLHPENTLAVRDLALSFLPSKILWRESFIDTFHPPFWNPYFLGGTPYWADLGHAALHPLNFIFLLFSEKNIHYAFSWFIWIHAPIACLGMFLFLRKLKIEHKIAGIFSVTYAISGAVFSSINAPNILGAACIMPFFFYFLIGWNNEKKLLNNNMLGLAFSTALCIIIGAPDYAYFFSLVLACYLPFHGKKGLGSGLMIALIAFLASAIQLLPGIEQLLMSSRGINKLSLIESQWMSFHPVRLIEILLPLPFGNYTENNYLGYQFTNGPTKMPLIFSCYIGLTTVFGILGLSFKSSKKNVLLVFSVLLTFILCIGVYSPLNLGKLFFSYLPLWNSFRYPEKILLFLNFFLIYLSAKGWNAIFNEPPQSTTKILQNISIGAILILIFIYFSALPKETVVSLLKMILLSTIIFFSVIFFLKIRVQNIALALLSFAIIFPLVKHDRAILWEQPSTIFSSAISQKIVNDLNTQKENISQGQAFRMVSFSNDAETALKNGMAPDELNLVGKVVWAYFSNLSTASNLFFKIPHITSHGTMHDSERELLWRELSKSNPEQLINILGARYIVKAPNIRGETRKVLVNLNAVPFLQAPDTVHILPNPIAFQKILEKSFNPMKELLLSGTENKSFKNRNSVKFNYTRLNQSTLKIIVSGANAPTWLQIGESFDSHWKVKFNQNTFLPTFKANMWCIGVLIPGDGELEIYYENNLIRWGVLLSAIAWLALLAWIVKIKINKRASA